MNVPAARGVASLAVAVAAIFVLLGIGVAVFFNPPFVAFEQGRANAAGWTGYAPDDLRSATDSILGELYAGPGTFDVSVGGAPVLNERERAHMRDVRGVFVAFGLVVLASAVVLAAEWRGSQGAPWFWRSVRSGAAALGIGVIVLGVAAAVAFDSLFEVFHQLFFAGGTYTFDPRTDRLVQLFPDQFWFETSVALAGVLLVLAVVVRALAGRRSSRTDPVASDALAARPEPAR